MLSWLHWNENLEHKPYFHPGILYLPSPNDVTITWETIQYDFHVALTILHLLEKERFLNPETITNSIIRREGEIPFQWLFSYDLLRLVKISITPSLLFFLV